MAFPQDRMPHRLRAAFGADAAADPSTWSWTDITAAVNDQQITITRGQPNEGGEPQPTSISLILDNVSGDYTPDNPEGAHYPDVDLGVPLEYSLEGAEPYLAMEGVLPSASTPDTAQVDITGSIDIRGELALDNWAPTTPVELASKYATTADQRSWIVLYNTNRRMVFGWSPDGTVGSAIQYSPTPVVPVPASGRIAWRVTLDTTNRQVTCYTAPSIAGPWTQLGDASTPGAATSVFNSSTPVVVGGADLGFASVQGAYYAFQLYDGIDGTTAADVDFTAQTPGDTSFTDDAGLTWTLNGAAEITLWRRRFLGNATSWEPVWPYGDLSTEDDDGAVVYEGESRVTVTASGVLRRLGQGADALQSTLRRRIPSFDPVAYWPAEDGQAATQWYSPIDGTPPLRTSGFDMAANDTLAGSAALPAIRADAILAGNVPAAPSGEWHTEFVCYIEAGPATARTVLQWLGTGTVARWRLMVTSTGCQIRGYDSDDTEIITHLVAIPDIFGRWFRWQLYATQNGADVDYTIRWVIIGVIGAHIIGTYTGTAGRISGVSSPGGSSYHADLDGVSIGHLAVFTQAGTGAYDNADHGFNGELSGTRMTRLCAEEGIPFTLIGDAADTEPMGPQRVATLLTLLTEAATVDGGFLGEQRSAQGLRYRTRTSLYNQTPALILDAADNEIVNPLAPVRDDQRIRNAVTVSRDGGSSAPASDETSIARHGRYEDPLTVNAYTDEQLEPIAFWRLHLGTWPGMRYPAVTTQLDIAPQRIEDWLTLDYGDRLQVLNLPRPQHPTATVDLLLQGYSETISPTKWTATANCRPAGPWNVGVIDDSSNGIIGKKIDSATSTTTAYVDTDDTLLPVKVASGLPWVTDPGEFPFDISAGGEEMTVTAIDNGAPVRDAFGRTESNGWGTADSGQVWTTTGGAASDYSVSSGEGRHAVNSVNVSRYTTAPSGDADFDALVSISTDALATGNSQQAYLVARFQNTSNFYAARLDFTTTQTITITIIKIVAGSPGAYPTATTTLTHTAGTKYRLRFQGIGAQLKAKVWLESASEPAGWDTEAADLDLSAAGSVGVRTRFLTGNTNTLPVVVAFTDFQDPQLFAVTRSVNRVTKPHTTGTGVRAVNAAPIAL